MKTNENKTYYENQLDKVGNSSEYGRSVKITSGDNETHWFNINKTSAKVLIDWLQDLYIN